MTYIYQSPIRSDCGSINNTLRRMGIRGVIEHPLDAPLAWGVAVPDEQAGLAKMVASEGAVGK